MSVNIQLHDLKFRPYISANEISQVVQQLAERLKTDYQGKTPVLLAVLNGSFVFAADLARYFDQDCQVSFVKMASYQGVSSTGEINTLIGLNSDLKGEDVIIVEDIIDSGLTMKNLVARINEKEPASVEIVSLLVKPDELSVPLQIKYIGFEIPSLFVVGYGMDYNELGRNLPAIYQLLEED